MNEPRLGPSTRALRGYGPLVAIVTLFALMVAFLPSVEQQVATQAPGAPDPGQRTVTTPTDPDDPDAPATDGTDGNGAAQQQQVTGNGQQQATGACAGRDKQVPGDPYSPPCIEWAGGDNGGDTWRGVTSDRITVSARMLDERGFQETLASLAGAEITDMDADVERTLHAYADYFNERFHFYGRELEIVPFQGSGSTTDELLGGGQAEAGSDAIEVAQTIGAFAEIRGATVPYTDALQRQGVVAFGTPYVSRQFHQERHPYTWSVSPEGSIVAESAAELFLNQLADRPAAFAGPGLQGQTRSIGTLSPENPWYQESADRAVNMVREQGYEPAVRIEYRLDIPSMSNQAANVIARLKSEGVTTVLCGCDPIFPVFLTARAAEQNYNPEWIVLGTAGTDIDLVGQLYNQDQWSRAFGVSYLGSPVPQRAGLGYAAYRAVRDDEPAFAAETIYAQLYMLVIGVHMAGPNLTPETFAQGMFDYPGGTGMYGTWDFNPNSYTPPADARFIWWDPDKMSPFNNRRGAYQEAFDGQRFRLGDTPRGDPTDHFFVD